MGIPGQIVEILDEDIYLAKAEVGGVRRNINIGLVHYDEQKIEAGDWVLIHVGFAMSKISEGDAAEQMRLLAMLGEDGQAMEELEGYRFN